MPPYGYGGHGYSPYTDEGYALAAMGYSPEQLPYAYPGGAAHGGHGYPAIGYPGYPRGPYNAISQGQVYPHGMMGGYPPYGMGMSGYYPRYGRDRCRKERSGGFEIGDRALGVLGYIAGANRPMMKGYHKLGGRHRR